jgi:ABC-type cobalt transport system substrate-binding protein
LSATIFSGGNYKKQIAMIVLLLAVFIGVLTFFIVPSQGGLISSTEQQADALTKVDPQFEETIPVQSTDYCNF